MYRKLKEQERKVKGGEEKEDMIDATEIDTEINTEGYTCLNLFNLCAWNIFLVIQISLYFLTRVTSSRLAREQNCCSFYYLHGYVD
jgi:hypothetical protein